MKENNSFLYFLTNNPHFSSSATTYEKYIATQKLLYLYIIPKA